MKPARNGARTSGDAELIIRPANAIKPRDVEWLWRGYVPLGYLTLLKGDPGLGKSTLTLDLAARVSTGRAMPGQQSGTTPAGVLVLSAEDGSEDVVIPRLQAAAADMARVHVVSGMRVGNEERPLTISDSVQQIEEACYRRGVKLIILDPLISFFMSEMNSFKDQDVRFALKPLTDLLRDIGTAALGVLHLNKRAEGPALYRGGGSIAFVAAARSVIALGRDHNDADVRVLASVKSNLGRSPTAHRLALVDTEQSVPRVNWLGECESDVDELLSFSAARRPRRALTTAIEFLQRVLAEGPVAVSEIERLARDVGISCATLRRAREEMAITPQKQLGTLNGSWYWSMPSSPREGAHEPTKPAPLPLKSACPSEVAQDAHVSDKPLETQLDGLSEWDREAFEERAAIIEADGIPRDQADAMAWKQIRQLIADRGA